MTCDWLMDLTKSYFLEKKFLVFAAICKTIKNQRKKFYFLNRFATILYCLHVIFFFYQLYQIDGAPTCREVVVERKIVDILHVCETKRQSSPLGRVLPNKVLKKSQKYPIKSLMFYA